MIKRQPLLTYIVVLISVLFSTQLILAQQTRPATKPSLTQPLALPASQSITETVSILPPGEQVTVMYDVVVGPLDGVSQISNQALVEADNAPPVPSDDPTQPGSADPTRLGNLALSKTASSSQTEASTEIVYTLTLANLGSTPFAEVVVEDVLPAEAVFSAAQATQGSYNHSTGLWTVGTVAPNPDLTLTITATANLDPGQRITNTAQIISLSGLELDSANNVSQAGVSSTGMPVTYTLSVSRVGSGTVTVEPEQEGYLAGTVVTLTANADSEAFFNGWSGDVENSDNPLVITMNSDTTLTATFGTEAPVTYTLSMNVVGSGTVTPTGGTYLSGTVVNLMATPAEFWRFAGWSGDASGMAIFPLLMDADKLVTATFTQSTIYLPLVLK